MTPYSGGGQLPAEWLTGTYTIKLDGPSHVTYSNVSVNSDFVVTVTAPAQIGMYTLTCAFNGSASYAPVTMTYPHPYTFSALYALGAVQLFSNPTTLAAGQKMDFYVVFHPASGLPMPTGQFSLWFGNNYTNSFTLGSSGAFLIHLSPLSSLAEVRDIQVFYMGDVQYNRATVHFPLTNQPIPSGANGDSATGSSGGNSAQGTPTTSADGTATTTTATPGDETTPTAVGAGGVLTSTPADSSGNIGLILIVVALLLLGGAGTAAGIVIYRMRRASALSNVSKESNGGAPASYDDLAARYGGMTPTGGQASTGTPGRTATHMVAPGNTVRMGNMGRMDNTGRPRRRPAIRGPGRLARAGNMDRRASSGSRGSMDRAGCLVRRADTGRRGNTVNRGCLGRAARPASTGVTRSAGRRLATMPEWVASGALRPPPLVGRGGARPGMRGYAGATLFTQALPS